MIKFNRSGYRALSSICSGIAQILFGGFLAGVTVLSLDVWKFLVLLLELGFSIGFWYLSIFFAEKGKL